jgi:alkylhydroperoxidase family enzyme
MESLAEFLRRVTLDERLVRCLEEDYTRRSRHEAERVILDYAVQITRDATRMGPRDHERLRAADFDDRAILQITLIVSWFNYINRVADALGVGQES